MGNVGTVEAMAAQGVALVLEDRLTPLEAAEKCLVDDDLEALRTLAVLGLRHRINIEIKDLRRRSAEVAVESEDGLGAPRSGKFQHRTLPSEAAGFFWLNKPYSTVDGYLAPLLEHGLDDWTYNLERATASAVGAVAKHAFFQKGQGAMAAHPKASKTSELPKKILEALEIEAERALMRGTVNL